MSTAAGRAGGGLEAGVYWCGAAACQSIARVLLSAIAFAGFFLNLVNLIPITPLDGGRITAIISPRVWLIGAPILLGLLFWKPSPAFLLIALVAMPQAWAALKGTVTPPGPAGAAAVHYYTASLEKRIEYATYYLGLVVFLGVMVFDLHAALPR